LNRLPVMIKPNCPQTELNLRIHFASVFLIKLDLTIERLNRIISIFKQVWKPIKM